MMISIPNQPNARITTPFGELKVDILHSFKAKLNGHAATSQVALKILEEIAWDSQVAIFCLKPRHIIPLSAGMLLAGVAIVFGALGTPVSMPLFMLATATLFVGSFLLTTAIRNPDALQMTLAAYEAQENQVQSIINDIKQNPTAIITYPSSSVD